MTLMQLREKSLPLGCRTRCPPACSAAIKRQAFRSTMPRIAMKPGTEIDGFTLGEKLHEGGMAAIYRVTKPGMDAPMIMKVPLVYGGDDPTMIVGFEVEQMILPRLSGPHCPTFIASNDLDVNPYMVMEEISGPSLISEFNAAPLPIDKIATIGAAVAQGLEALHRQDVIHLDLKPSNVMLRPDGRAVFIDFGLSRHRKLPDLMAEEFRVPMGTAPYIAPEQVFKFRDDHRSDIFALGCMLYAFTTGERPFGNPAHTTKALSRRLWQWPMPPRMIRPDCPFWLQEIILRCLEVDPDKRYPTAAQLAFDLSHPEQVKLTLRAARIRSPRMVNFLRGLGNMLKPLSFERQHVPGTVLDAPIVAVAVDLSPEMAQIAQKLLETAQKFLALTPGARLACINVLRTNKIGIDTMVDDKGDSLHLKMLIALKNWAEPLKLDQEQISFHVLESSDPADALITYARNNNVDHLIVGARGSSTMRRYLGSVSAKVVAQAACSVTVIRTAHKDEELVQDDDVT
jgi:serine/threonine protein kinase